MRIKVKKTTSPLYERECMRLEREKRFEMAACRELKEMRRQTGAKRGEGRIGARSRYAVLNAIRTEGKEVMSPDAKGFWDDMARRYPWQDVDGMVPDSSSPNGHVGRFGKVSERFVGGRWYHWDGASGGWIEGEASPRKGVA
jgi:hypothetical protein